MSEFIPNDRVITVDCDDTLVMWDLSKYPDLRRVNVSCYGASLLAVNEKNVNLVIKLYRLGYHVVVWSQSGAKWAKAVSEAVGIDQYVGLYMSKPRYHIDDLDSRCWMGERIWRDPVTGKSEENK